MRGGCEFDMFIAAGQALMIGAHQIIALVFRNETSKSRMGFGKEMACAIAIEPIDFTLARGENSAQHKAFHALRKSLHIGERQSRAP